MRICAGKPGDASSLADIVAKMAGVAKEHVKILDCQCGSVIASTVIMAPDWSVASAKLEISLMDESGPLKHMGVVGCAGLLGGVVGKPPLPATAAAAAAAAAAREAEYHQLAASSAAAAAFAEQQETALGQKVSELEMSLNDLAHHVALRDGTLAAKEDVLGALREEVAAKGLAKTSAEEALMRVQASLDTVTRRLGDFEKEHADAVKENFRMVAEISEGARRKDEEIQELKSSIASAELQYSTAMAQSDAAQAEYRTALSARDSALASLQMEMGSKLDAIRNLESCVHELGSAMQEKANVISQCDREMEALRSEMEAKQEEHAKVLTRVEANEAEHGRVLSEMQAKEAAHAKTLSDMEAAHAKLLSEMAAKEAAHAKVLAEMEAREAAHGEALSKIKTQEVMHAKVIAEMEAKEAAYAKNLAEMQAREAMEKETGAHKRIMLNEAETAKMELLYHDQRLKDGMQRAEDVGDKEQDLEADMMVAAEGQLAKLCGVVEEVEKQCNLLQERMACEQRARQQCERRLEEAILKLLQAEQIRAAGERERDLERAHEKEVLETSLESAYLERSRIEVDCDGSIPPYPPPLPPRPPSPVFLPSSLLPHAPIYIRYGTNINV